MYNLDFHGFSCNFRLSQLYVLSTTEVTFEWQYRSNRRIRNKYVLCFTLTYLLEKKTDP